MKVLPLKKRGVETSRLVLGCMPFGGEWNKDPITDQNIKDSEAALDAALEIGINLLDTANVYRWGKSETIIGKILKDRPALREQVIIQSKCGIRPGENGLPTRFDFSKEHIIEAAEASLKRLDLDYMDILLLHRPDPLMDPEEVAEAFGKLKAQGKVRYFGVSNMNVSQMQFLQSALPDELAVNQLEISLSHLDWLDQTIHVNQKAGQNIHFGEGLLEYCQLENVQIQAWGPLSQGIFSGRDVSDRPETVQNTAKLVKQMADEKGTTPEAIVLGWIMKHPAAIQPVIGSIKPDRIKACQDGEKQAELMTREEWYSLYTSSRGKPMP